MKTPNIISIAAGDHGFADLGCYGGRDAASGPVSRNSERFAAGGLRLTQGYANSPVCSPTRFGQTYSSYSAGSPAPFLGYQLAEAPKVEMTHAPCTNMEVGAMVATNATEHCSIAFIE